MADMTINEQEVAHLLRLLTWSTTQFKEIKETVLVFLNKKGTDDLVFEAICAQNNSSHRAAPVALNVKPLTNFPSA